VTRPDHPGPPVHEEKSLLILAILGGVTAFITGLVVLFRRLGRRRCTCGRLMSKKRDVVSPATYASTGLAEITHTCTCGQTVVEKKELPVLSDSSSDSGGGYSSSDSGGSSSSSSDGSGGGGSSW